MECREAMMDESLGWILAQLWMLFSPIAETLAVWGVVALAITLALAFPIAMFAGRCADRRMYKESEWTDVFNCR